MAHNLNLPACSSNQVSEVFREYLGEYGNSSRAFIELLCSHSNAIRLFNTSHTTEEGLSFERDPSIGWELIDFFQIVFRECSIYTDNQLCSDLQLAARIYTKKLQTFLNKTKISVEQFKYIILVLKTEIYYINEALPQDESLGCNEAIMFDNVLSNVLDLLHDEKYSQKAIAQLSSFVDIHPWILDNYLQKIEELIEAQRTPVSFDQASGNQRSEVLMAWLEILAKPTSYSDPIISADLKSFLLDVLNKKVTHRHFMSALRNSAISTELSRFMKLVLSSYPPNYLDVGIISSYLGGDILANGMWILLDTLMQLQLQIDNKIPMDETETAEFKAFNDDLAEA